MITYQRENWDDVLEELQQILPTHYEELTVSKNFPLDPDWTRYDRLNKANMLCFYSVRDDKKLIGYTIMLIGPGLHYQSCMTAHEDIYYVLKDYRKGRIGLKMFQFVEKELKAQGVDRVVMGTKVYSDNSKLFEYLGYRLFEKLYDKEL